MNGAATQNDSNKVPSLSTDINVISSEIKGYQQMAGQSIFEIGRRLSWVKENDLVHGEWLNWLDSINIEKTFAKRAMKIAKELNGAPGNSGITPGTGSNSGTGNSNGSGNETVQNNVKNSTGSKVKLEALQNSNVKGEAKKNVTANKAGTLPQTDEQHENVASLIGMVLLGGSMALFGIKRRKHDDE